MVKISFLGDLMCEKPFLRAAQTGSGFDFSGFLEPCRALFSKSDYIVGNLETPCDPDSDLTQDMFVFNAPKAFLQAVRDAGIHFLTTATNHCLDRGERGLTNTIQTLEELGIAHTGTFRSPEDKRFEVVELTDGTRAAIVSCTYGTNYMDNHVRIPEDRYYMINYLTPLYSGRNQAYDEMSYSLRARLTRMVPRGFRVKMNSLLGRSSNLAFADKIQQDDIDEENQDAIKRILAEAGREADCVIVCPHFGGQFNTEPGTYVETFTAFFEANGADLMVGNHPHVAQKIEKRSSKMLAAYSLGNVSMSLSTPYVVKDDLPDYSIMLHVYMEKKAICKVTFSILIEKEQQGFIRVYPAKELYDCADDEERKTIGQNCRTIYNRVLNRTEDQIEILDEYPVAM